MKYLVPTFAASGSAAAFPVAAQSARQRIKRRLERKAPERRPPDSLKLGDVCARDAVARQALVILVQDRGA